jgi:hypothetical protein
VTKFVTIIALNLAKPKTAGRFEIVVLILVTPEAAVKLLLLFNKLVSNYLIFLSKKWIYLLKLLHVKQLNWFLRLQSSVWKLKVDLFIKRRRKHGKLKRKIDR